ncbi:MAG: sulfite exporter TauE/SafE family protein [Desulfuromonadales bacterium]
MIYLWMGIVWLGAGLIQGLTGFGSALVAVPLLSLFLDLKLVVPFSTLHGVTITLCLSWQLRRSLSLQKIGPLLLGCVPGITIGVTLLKYADPVAMKLMLGVLVTGYAIYALLSQPIMERKLRPFWAYVAGFATGAIASAFSAGGPPTIIYTTLAGWSKDTIKATLSGFFLCAGLLASVAHLMAGLTTFTVAKYYVATLPFVLLGVWVGSRFYQRINHTLYLKAVFCCLALMGLVLAVSAVR